MPSPAISTNFTDLLDPRFNEVFDSEYTQLPDMVGDFYRVTQGKLSTERYSQVGALPEISAFTGTVTYGDISQGYDTTVTPLQFAQGFQVERALWDDDQTDIIMNKPKTLADSIYRLRQIHRVRPFVNAFSVDTYFYTNSENVAMCSNSHTTTSGASTTNGFDNYVTTALSATSVAALRIQMIKHRNDQGQEIGIMPDTLYIPVDLYETAYEIVASAGKVDQATNNANVHYGQYKLIEDLWLSTRGDTNNWFMMDSKLMKRWGLLWVERNKGEFGMVEDFDTLLGKWRAYMRWGNSHLDWRWVSGAEVS